MFCLLNIPCKMMNYNLLPLLPPFLLVPSVGIGVTSSTLPILKPIFTIYINTKSAK